MTLRRLAACRNCRTLLYYPQAILSPQGHWRKGGPLPETRGHYFAPRPKGRGRLYVYHLSDLQYRICRLRRVQCYFWHLCISPATSSWWEKEVTAWLVKCAQKVGQIWRCCFSPCLASLLGTVIFMRIRAVVYIEQDSYRVALTWSSDYYSI